MDPLAIAGLGIGLIGGIGSMFGAKKSNRQLEKLMKLNPAYKANPIANQRMGMAQTLLNARAPGAAAAERNIYQTQGNTMANINRNVTDSSQALAMGAATQGQTNQDFGNLQNAEAQDYQRRYSNLEGAQQGVIQEGDKVFQDQVRRFQDMAQIKGMQNANRQGAWQGLSNLGFGAMSLGMAGGSQNLFGSGTKKPAGGTGMSGGGSYYGGSPYLQ
jgi:hypothetical protein